MEKPKLTAADIERKYGIRLIAPRPLVRPIEMDLSGPEGHRVWMTAARRVMVKHAKTLAALAKR
ncbi:hypothetical protein PQR68_34595 [Paraburkholderia agricolaris]|uniref:hypothetical protein n=1 Tax=Paraburkholderia agricolaris TaxID=2152888 RepID=UPI0038BCB825